MMTDTHNITTRNRKIVIKPLPKVGKPVFLSAKNKITLMKGASSARLFLKQSISQQYARNRFKEDVIYESKTGDFLVGNPHVKLTIVNQLNLITNSSRTIAKYFNVCTEELIKETTSDNVARLIGQKNYDTVFSALCSVISQELKIRGMLALLTIQKKLSEFMGQTEESALDRKSPEKVLEEKCCQTEENCMDILFKAKQKKRIKRTQLTPYVVKDIPEPKKVVIHPNTVVIMDPDNNIKYELTEQGETAILPDNDGRYENESLPELKPHLKHYLSDDSNDGSIGALSVGSIEDILKNPSRILDKVDQYTSQPTAVALNPTYITMLDGSQIMVTVKPEDHFHIATPEILKNVTNEERIKLLWFQAYIDFKFCLHRDEDDYLPIHLAVMNDDVDLLRRQCLVLRNRHASLDLTAHDRSPLQMSLQQSPKCTAMLLQYGADPLFTDAEERSVLHLACEATPEHLRSLITYCQNNAREILKENEELWSLALETKTKEQLSEYLLDHMCKSIDGQGYTPLMVASKTGMHASVKLLVEASPKTVNMAMPNGGNTALYLAVGSACIDAENRGNKSKLNENFKSTIQILMSNGADSSIVNHSGQTVNDLLTEFNIADLSMLVANTITKLNYGIPQGSMNFDSYMLVKEKDGKVNVKELDKSRNIPKNKFTKAAKADKKAKPVILENITLPSTKALNKVTTTKTMTNLKVVSPKDKLETLKTIASAMDQMRDEEGNVDDTNKIVNTFQNTNRAQIVDNSSFVSKYTEFVTENENRVRNKKVFVKTHYAKANSCSDATTNVKEEECSSNYASASGIPNVGSSHSGKLVIDTEANLNDDSSKVKREMSNVVNVTETFNVITNAGVVSVQNAVKRKAAATTKVDNKVKKQRNVRKTDKINKM